MEFNEVIRQRKTSREWTDREVDFEAIKRILAAGMKAPSWDHYRNWQFIVLHERGDKKRAFAYAKAVAKRYVDSNRTYVRPNPAQKMYAYAMPRQYTMLVDCPYVIVPLFKCSKTERRMGEQAQSAYHCMVRCGEHHAGRDQRGAGLLAAHPAEQGA